MYLPELLNFRDFFQRTASWHEDPEFGESVTVLLNRATSAVLSIQKIEEYQRFCVQEFSLFDDQVENVEDKIVFNSKNMVLLQNEISPLLSALRLMQETTNQLIAKKYPKANLPNSLSDTAKKINKFNIPKDLRILIKNYWKNSGKKIRDYRVFDQHHSTLADMIFLLPGKRVLFLFPDNPEEKSKRKLTYNNEVCGFSELRIGFDDLHEFIENIAEYFGYEKKPLNISTGLHQLGDLQPFRKRLLAFIYEDPISQLANGKLQKNISGIRISQKEDGRLEVQKMLLSKKKLGSLKKISNEKNSWIGNILNIFK